MDAIRVAGKKFDKSCKRLTFQCNQIRFSIIIRKTEQFNFMEAHISQTIADLHTLQTHIPSLDYIDANTSFAVCMCVSVQCCIRELSWYFNAISANYYIYAGIIWNLN